MGGGYYDHDVARRARSTNSDVFTFSGYSGDSGSRTVHNGPHPKLDPYGAVRECVNETPLVVALDVTRSRGDDSKIMYDNLPTFIGEIERHGYVEGAALSFAAIGDAKTDKAPLQVGQFEADNRLDEVLSKFWIEEGGGGTGQESYEMAAFYYARQSRLACVGECRKGWFFLVGDEGYHPQVDPTEAKRWLKIDLDAPIPAAVAFRELQEKYHVFFVFQEKNWDQRKADIDAEVRTRVEAAGGMYAGVDVRASLIWNNRNDLDLHVIAPSGEHIYYGDKRSACGGWLDVDMNVSGDTTKPVENVRWAKGEAPAGTYKVYVQNYRQHEPNRNPTEYRVEVEINGKIHQFDGLMSPKGETSTSSNQQIGEFRFDPSARLESAEVADVYEQYDDELILRSWREVLPPENVLVISDPHALIDVILGTLAVRSAGHGLDEFLAAMKTRGQTQERIDQIARALRGLAPGASTPAATVSGSLETGERPERSKRSKRL